MDSRLNYILVDDDELYRDYTHMQLEDIFLNYIVWLFVTMPLLPESK